MKRFPFNTGKHVFIHYEGAIREAIYVRTEIHRSGICGSKPYAEYYFRVAGIKDGEPVKVKAKEFYYSQEDAVELKNSIQLEEVTLDYYNSLAENFWFTDLLYVYAYIWCKTKPEVRSLHAGRAYGVVTDGVMKVYDENTGRQIDLSGCYKTKEECMAHNRAEVVTF